MERNDIDRTAPVTVRHSMLIDAPLDLIWRLHIDVNGWPAWQRDIDSASLDGPLEAGATFHWTTFGLAIDSAVFQVEPMRRTLWGGPAAGIEGVHSWTFQESPGGVQVTTEESWSGPPVEADVADAKAKLDAAVASWLRFLKAAASG